MCFFPSTYKKDIIILPNFYFTNRGADNQNYVFSRDVVPQPGDRAGAGHGRHRASHQNGNTDSR